MTKHIRIACLFTLITAFALGIVYPLVITGVAQVFMRNKADGQLLVQHGVTIGSALIGQPFTGPAYFHSRPSAAGAGYDASASSGSNLAPTNKTLIDRVNLNVESERNGASSVPIDLVTASGSGLDPDITPAAALYQVHRVAQQRHLPEAALQTLVLSQITQRQLGLLGEPRVNILRLNLALAQLPNPNQ